MVNPGDPVPVTCRVLPYRRELRKMGHYQAKSEDEMQAVAGAYTRGGAINATARAAHCA